MQHPLLHEIASKPLENPEAPGHLSMTQNTPGNREPAKQPLIRVLSRDGVSSASTSNQEQARVAGLHAKRSRFPGKNGSDTLASRSWI